VTPGAAAATSQTTRLRHPFARRMKVKGGYVGSRVVGLLGWRCWPSPAPCPEVHAPTRHSIWVSGGSAGR
jgi:hypothetical protein